MPFTSKELEACFCAGSHDQIDVCLECGWHRFPKSPLWGEVALEVASQQTPASALACTLAERKARYGDFTDHARISEAIMQAVMSGMGWQKATPVQRQSLRAFADKMARISGGDPNYPDNWHDIAGYATLAEERCK